MSVRRNYINLAEGIRTLEADQAAKAVLVEKVVEAAEAVDSDVFSAKRFRAHALSTFDTKPTFNSETETWEREVTRTVTETIPAFA